MDDGRRKVSILDPPIMKGATYIANPADVQPVRHVGLRWQNYTDAVSYLPPEANFGLTYLKNTLVLVILSVIGTLISSSIVAYAFSRMRFPGRNLMFTILSIVMRFKTFSIPEPKAIEPRALV